MWIVPASADGDTKAISRYSFQKDLMVFPNNSFSTLEKMKKKLIIVYVFFSFVPKMTILDVVRLVVRFWK